MTDISWKRVGNIQKLFHFGLEFTWNNARAYCHSIGGHLVELNHVWELTELLQELQNLKINGFWTGGNDLVTEGSYLWDESSKPIQGVTFFL